MKIESSAFSNNSPIPEKYSCDGANISPPLRISNVPPHAKSLALIVNDPDATGGDFVHWLLWNIDASVRLIEEGTNPIGACDGVNDAGNIGWSGPCPPSGVHRYFFRLYALRDFIGLTLGATKEDFRKAINGLVIEEAFSTGLYERKGKK